MSIIEYRKSQTSEVNDPIETIQSVELNIIELCNRSCIFCPRHDKSVYPNRNLKMDIKTIHSIGKSLSDISYKNLLDFCGFGEPLLHPHIVEMVKILHSYVGNSVKYFEIICNGDFLKEDIIIKLYDAGIKKILINLYDGESQVEKFNSIFSKLGISSDKYIFRHNYGLSNNTGMVLTNRSGLVTGVGFNDKFPLHEKCFIPFYKMFIDWNGDLVLCNCDWGRRSKISNIKLNINEMSIRDIWLSEQMNEYRRNLLVGNRCLTPCNTCNAKGNLNGSASFEYFSKNIL